ncbi:MAG: hypothetical protein KAT65_17950 [Methanophagales archaeon]|nr:hypothetical protein [Methanophagales archaeon]
MELFNLVSVIVLLVVALQFIIKNFVADVLERHWLNQGKDVDIARTKRNDFVRKWMWVILILFIAAIILGTIGLLGD